jgi:hypothetical protein
MEIADICIELKKLSGSGLLTKRTADACKQAAALLTKMRALILSGRGLPSETGDTISKLKDLLAKQGEG